MLSRQCARRRLRLEAAGRGFRVQVNPNPANSEWREGLVVVPLCLRALCFVVVAPLLPSGEHG